MHSQGMGTLLASLLCTLPPSHQIPAHELLCSRDGWQEL